MHKNLRQTKMAIKTNLSLVALVFALLCFRFAEAEVLFEGYSKVLIGGVHVGYTVSRYEFDPQKKEFTASTFLKTNSFGGGLTESLKAKSDENLLPLEYQYNYSDGKKTKKIEVKFQENKKTKKLRMLGQIIEGAQPVKIDQEFSDDVFLSSFLAYRILRSKKGMVSGVKYEYTAIAEEDAAAYKGVSFVKEQELVKGIKAFKILNDFKGVKYVSYASFEGQVLSTKSPVQSIQTELVSKKESAIQNQSFSPEIMKLIFGSVPTGEENVLAKAEKTLVDTQNVANTGAIPRVENPVSESTPNESEKQEPIKKGKANSVPVHINNDKTTLPLPNKGQMRKSGGP